MPFLTEEIWQRLPGHEAIHAQTICLAPFPTPVAEWESDEHEAAMSGVMELVTRIRALRTERKISAKTKTRLHLAGAGPLLETLRAQAPLVKALCRLEAIELGAAPAGAVLDSLAGVEFALVPESGANESSGPGAAAVDGQLLQLRDEIARAEARLADESFVSKAPARVVEGNRARLAELRERYARLAAGSGAAGPGA